MYTVGTFAAQEQRLRTTIVPGLIPTTRAGLTGVPRINFLDTHPTFLPFVGDEAKELSKGPAMQFAFVLNVLVLFATPLREVSRMFVRFSRTMVAPAGVLATICFERT